MNLYIRTFHIWCFYFIVAFLFLFAFAYSITPATPFEGCDSCVFKQMGLVILKGETPYLDLFDHKGPLLYLINASGLWLGNGKWGIFILYTVYFSFVLYYWDALARHYTSGHKAVISILLILILYLFVIEEGNLTEDWSLLPLSYCTYLTSRLFARDIIPAFFEAILFGLSVGVVFFIRPNNAALQVCAFILISILLIRKKEFSFLIKFYLGAFIGFSLLTLAICFFFYFKYGKIGFEEMIYGSFIFNMSYSTWNLPDFYHVYVINHHEKYNFFAFSALFFCAYSYYNNRRVKDNCIIVSFFILSFIFSFLMMGTKAYDHYLIVLLPLFVMCVNYAIRNSLKDLLFCIIFTYWVSYDKMMELLSYSTGYTKDYYVDLYQSSNSFLRKIDLSDRKSIWNYNADFRGIQYLQHNGIIQCNRIILNFQCDISEKLKRSEEGKLELIKPRFILLNRKKPYINKRDSIFINSNYCCSYAIEDIEILKRIH